MSRYINNLHAIRSFSQLKNTVENPFLNIKTTIKRLVPSKPIQSKINLEKLPKKTQIDEATIALLERLSLVDCANKKGIATLEAAIEFADRIQQVDTKGVEPLITVLEDIPLGLREDKITEGNCKEDILKNASILEEEYFVAPPGNIPLESREDLLFKEENIQNVKKHS